MRSHFLPLTLGLVFSPALINCGDDKAGTPDAAPKTDAGPKMDAPPDPEFGWFNADEGGEIRVEYVRNAAGASTLRMTAFFFKDAGSTDFTPFVSQNGCTRAINDDRWPLYTNPLPERDYHNPGAVVLKGGPMDFKLKWTGGMAPDPFGRVHCDANHPCEWGFKGPNFTNGGDASMYLSEKTLYDLEITGMAEPDDMDPMTPPVLPATLPAQTFNDVLYMPADFDLLNPGSAPVALTPGADMMFTWETPTNGTPPVDPSTGEPVIIQSLVGFTGVDNSMIDTKFGPVVVCIENNDGMVTVPAAEIDLVIAETQKRRPATHATPFVGTLARQTLTHQVRELHDENGPTGKRVDIIAVWCYATQFTVPVVP